MAKGMTVVPERDRKTSSRIRVDETGFYNPKIQVVQEEEG
jgi:hypothetical protein